MGSFGQAWWMFVGGAGFDALMSKNCHSYLLNKKYPKNLVVSIYEFIYLDLFPILYLVKRRPCDTTTAMID